MLGLSGMLGLPLTINAVGTVMSPMIPSFDLPKQSLFVTSPQAGSLVLSRCADRGGINLIDATTMTASVQCSITLPDSKYSLSLQIKVVNSAAVAASLSGAFCAVGQ